MFENKPEHCPYGHPLWPGKRQVSWTPCICAPAQDAAERRRGMGHITVRCRTCEAEHMRVVFYEPPHDTRSPAADWLDTGPLNGRSLPAGLSAAGRAEGAPLP